MKLVLPIIWSQMANRLGETEKKDNERQDETECASY